METGWNGINMELSRMTAWSTFKRLAVIVWLYDFCFHCYSRSSVAFFCLDKIRVAFTCVMCLSLTPARKNVQKWHSVNCVLDPVATWSGSAFDTEDGNGLCNSDFRHRYQRFRTPTFRLWRRQSCMQFHICPNVGRKHAELGQISSMLWHCSAFNMNK